AEQPCGRSHPGRWAGRSGRIDHRRPWDRSRMLPTVTAPAQEPLRVKTSRGVETFPVTTQVVIGRDHGVEVLLTHEKASRRHLTIAWEPGAGWVATDGSSNGTYRDGAKVGRFVIAGTVRLMLGNPTTGEPVELMVGPVMPMVAPAQPMNPTLGHFSVVY